MDQAQQTRRSVAQLAGPRRQRGWVGLVAILLALVIVAVLAQKALKSYLEPAAEAARELHAPAGASAAPGDAAGPTAAPVNPIARARGLEQQVQRDAQDIDKRMDESSK